MSYSKATQLLMTCSVLLLWSVPIDASPSAQYEAEQAFRNGRFEQAMSIYQDLLSQHDPKTAPSPDLLQGLGATLYRLNRFEEARRTFEQARALSATAEERAAISYNEGNALAQLRRYEEAIQRYDESLRNDPSTEAARINRDYIRKFLSQPPKQGSQSRSKQQSEPSSGEKGSSGTERAKGQKDSSDSKRSEKDTAGEDSGDDRGSKSQEPNADNQRSADADDGQKSDNDEKRDEAGDETGDETGEKSGEQSDDSSQRESPRPSSAGRDGQGDESSLASGAESEEESGERNGEVVSGEVLLNSVRESYDGLRAYRRALAEAELRRTQRRRSVNDW